MSSLNSHKKDSIDSYEYQENNSSNNVDKELVFKFGIDRESVVYEGYDLANLKELAAVFIQSKYPSCTKPGIVDSIMLFRHDYRLSNSLELVQSVNILNNNDTLEIVLKDSFSLDDSSVRSHMLYVYSYKSPTFCDHCGVMLFGLVRQGLKCEGCGGNFHKKCAFKIPNDCSAEKPLVNGSSYGTSTAPRRMSEQWTSLSNDGDISLFSLSSTTTLQRQRRNTWSAFAGGRPPDIDRLVNKLEIPHTFVIHSYCRPTVCHVCKKLLKGLFRQGYQCKDCKFNCHRDKKCLENAPRNCLGDINEKENPPVNNDADITDNDHNTEPDEEESIVKIELTETSSIQIPLQRIAMSVGHRKTRGSKILKSAWMIHYTESDQVKNVHYWRLDTKSLCFYVSESTTEFVKEILLSEILAVDSNMESMRSNQGGDYLFVLKTRTEIYYCGERDHYDPNGAVFPNDPKSGKGTRIGISWAEEIKSAFHSVSGNQKTLTTLQVEFSEDKLEKEIELNGERDISQVYQIFPDEILGSGQFGIVYGGVHRTSGKDVAIKVIDKHRLPTKEERGLKNEVIILENINYPGVVNLERMFETAEKIFVVMQKMKGDMLELILSSPNGRLTEKQTKFICYQILTALHFLHEINIVHCDLKPENVLLSGVSSKGGFPQIKLCDFGFSRIIGRESFRRSKVGTPAYLPPEVLNNKKYNRSLDMWSIGVIIYVSVSGTFPFNEDEEITDQIKNAAFMYPTYPWGGISKECQDLINQLLQVKIKSRLTCKQALLHAWMQDYEIYTELRSLETLVGVRYITHESDDAAWARYLQSKLFSVESIDEETNPNIICSFCSLMNFHSFDNGLRPHMLYVHSYKSPTFCDYCAVMLFGLVRQGLKCEGCNGNFHKKCAFKILNNCSGVQINRNGCSTLSPSSRSFNLDSNNLDKHTKDRRNTIGPTDSKNMTDITNIPHTFVVHTYGKPTQCHNCRKLLIGLLKQGYQCKDCKYNCHLKCIEKVERNCHGERALDIPDVDDNDNPVFQQNHDEEDGFEKPSVSENNIPLQRIASLYNSNSPRNRKIRGSKILKSDWLVHFTESDKTKKVHYWRLYTKCICLYQSDTAKEPIKEIPLSEINEEPMVRHGRDPYLFILKTNTEIYYCGEGDSYDANGAIIASSPNSGKGTHIAIAWSEKIRNAFKSVAASHEVEENLEENVDISLVYQIFSDEVLGSGQFGIVYGGVHRKTKKEVAVKVIDKSRFPTQEERALKNEVTILENISHPAVVNLERMFETPERIFVVMQKMKGDMLEMILGSPNARLTEKQTKFICHQILAALNFLHKMDIVHCDLKPENVLLSGVESKEGFPQIKLCDFGFSRIIGRESFRRSIVGTPAYLAPEVLSNKKYNRSLDMWSVGVIIYVSVSGTFPFNEDEDIPDQIKNAAFMYPPQPWAEISKDAQDLINQLLQVKMKIRLTCQQALIHKWMQDLDTFLELRRLEEKVGIRYITHESDDVAWAQYDPTKSFFKESKDTFSENNICEKNQTLANIIEL
nr:serine/threonine-protein kinase D3 [Hydra vulgaris]